jgi:hypothetical protein
MESPRERNRQKGDDWEREEQLWFIYGEGRGDLVRESKMWRLWLGEGKGKGSRGWGRFVKIGGTAASVFFFVKEGGNRCGKKKGTRVGGAAGLG